MKIDFRGTYDSLANVVNHRPRPVSKDSDFGRLLGGVHSDSALHQPITESVAFEEDARPKLSSTLTKAIAQTSVGNPDPTPITTGLNKRVTDVETGNAESLQGEKKVFEQIKNLVSDSLSKLNADIGSINNPATTKLKETLPEVEIPVLEHPFVEPPEVKFQSYEKISTFNAKTVSFDPTVEIRNLASGSETLFTPRAIAPSPKMQLPIKESISSAVTSAGQKFGVDPALGLAVAHQESGLNHKAISMDGHGSKGVFQLLDKTGKDLMARQGLNPEMYDPFNPELNVNLGMGYLRYLHDIFSAPVSLTKSRKTYKAVDHESLEKFAVAAFNAGEGRVASAQSRALAAGKDPSTFTDVLPYLPKSTQSYVAKVLNQRNDFAQAGEQESPEVG
jgi:soluble lytic murein transglycosylase-like protein